MSRPKKPVPAWEPWNAYNRQREPVEAPARSYCPKCHRWPPFVVWHDGEWCCTVCADAVTVPA